MKGRAAGPNPALPPQLSGPNQQPRALQPNQELIGVIGLSYWYIRPAGRPSSLVSVSASAMAPGSLASSDSSTSSTSLASSVSTVSTSGWSGTEKPGEQGEAGPLSSLQVPSLGVRDPFSSHPPPPLPALVLEAVGFN